MSGETIGQGKPDLKALDEYLMSDESPENCMQLSDLDGFLTAIVVGPELIQVARCKIVELAIEVFGTDSAPMARISALTASSSAAYFRSYPCR